MGTVDGRRSGSTSNTHGHRNERYLGDDPANPLWIAELPFPRDMKRELMTVAFSLIPFVVVFLITRPDIRRTMLMRSSLFVKRVADSQERMWADVAMKAAQSYQNARI